MSLRHRLLFLVAFVLLALFGGAPAVAACGSLPYTFTNSTSIVDALTTNANNNFLYQCATNVDNTQIGAAGLFASQILPSSVATGTFGGSFPFTFALTAPAQVPLSIIGAAAQSADLFDVWNNGQASDLFYIDSSGSAHFLQTVALQSTGANTITSNTTGANVAFILNASNASPPSGDLVDFKLTGAIKAIISNTGAFSTAAAPGFINTAGVTNNDFQWKCGSGSTTCALAQNASATISGVSGTVLDINNGTNTTAGAYLTLDTTGNLGLSGGLFATLGNFSNGNAAILTNGDVQSKWALTLIGATHNYRFILDGSDNGLFQYNAVNHVFLGTGGGVKTNQTGDATLSYVPPVYTSAGAAVASTLHGVSGTWTCTTGSFSATNQEGSCASSIVTWSGAAVFSSATSYQCSESFTSNSQTGAFSYMFAVGGNSTNGGFPITTATTARFGGSVNTFQQTFVSSGQVTLNGTYFCVGT